MTPLFQANFACAVAPARYARLRSTTRLLIPNLQKQCYSNHIAKIQNSTNYEASVKCLGGI